MPHDRISPNKRKASTKPEGLRVQIPAVYQPLFQPYRYKLCRGGRGAARSWSIGRALLAIGRSQKKRILCTREYQTSIKDSVHQVLKTQIDAMGITRDYDVGVAEIRCPATGSEFIFKGLRHDPQGIKSLEGIDIAWIEEAQTVSGDSLVILDPTIRRPGSEIWVSYNPDSPDDAIEEYFIKHPLPGSIIIDATWRDNPFFPEVLDKQRAHAESLAKATGDWDAYNWIWEGQYRRVSDALVFKRRVCVEDFETPPGVEFRHGADWGFANDPTALVRCYLTDEFDGKHLWIDQEAFGYGVEIDETPALFHSIPTSRNWPIKADCSRPETISALARANFNISAAEKWPGCVEDGIAYLKGFVKIHIHERCKHMQEEAKLYRYKIDRVTEEVLPVLVDANNHGWDAVRYSLDGYIRHDESEVWGAIGRQMA